MRYILFCFWLLLVVARDVLLEGEKTNEEGQGLPFIYPLIIIFPLLPLFPLVSSLFFSAISFLLCSF
jgi:hypothetical protein